MTMLAGLPRDRRCEITGVILLGLAALLFLILATDGHQGSANRPMPNAIEQYRNALGYPGAVVATILTLLLGHAAHVLYLLLAVWGLMLFRHQPLDRLLTRFAGMVILCGAVAGMLHVDFASPEEQFPGGAVGAFSGNLLLRWFGTVPSNVVGITLALIGILLATEFLFVRMAAHGHSFGMLILGGAVIVTRMIGRAYRIRQERRLELQRLRLEAEVAGRDENSASRAIIDVRATEPVKEEPPAKSKRKNAKQSGNGEDESTFSWNEFLNSRPESLPRDEAPAQRSRPARASEPEIRIAGREMPSLEPEERPDPFADLPAFQPIPEEPLAVEGKAEPAPEPPEEAPREADTADVPASEPLFEAPLVVQMNGGEASSFAAPEESPDEAAPPAVEAPRRRRESNPIFTAGPLTAADLTARRNIQLRRKALIEEELPDDYVYPKRFTKPSLDLFDLPPPQERPDLGDQLRRTSMLLEETLLTFGIEARVTDVTRGPTITRFELEPAPGIKVSRFLALADDIALALKAYRVRVEAPIPGKGRVGIEVPNTEREPVVVRELLESRVFKKSRAQLPLALGKDIAGDVVVADLTTMPHMLVAGATGAGKTVCVKSLLASLLCTKTPEELQLMLIDPKMVEMSIFNDIPHLITPVVTDPKKAAGALQWLINEMQERYRLFADLRTRNIEVYNESVENGEIEMHCADEEGGAAESLNVIRKLPYIVCMIDELADLMLQVRAEVEDAIARLAQLARAVGIHLIIATQRPSVDVLTGVIKANFPARISFQVSSRVDSRCILDEIGAERLIGRGDMLYLPAGHSKPTRIQGAFVSDEEMNALVAYLKTQAPPQYRDEIEKYGKSKDSVADIGDEDDELFDEAVRVVLETGQASISMVQRRLRVGYTRAARLIDMMEMRGIVGPHLGSKAREILVSLPPGDDEET
jgi:DNA segregation ATPase FtsK/SpoIIIE-like protein